MTQYRQEKAIDGRWSRDIQPVMREEKPFKLACCDCGLVHDVEFWVEGGNVMMRFARDNRATGQKRRHMRGRRVRALSFSHVAESVACVRDHSSTRVENTPSSNSWTSSFG